MCAQNCSTGAIIMFGGAGTEIMLGGSGEVIIVAPPS